MSTFERRDENYVANDGNEGDDETSTTTAGQSFLNFTENPKPSEEDVRKEMSRLIKNFDFSTVHPGSNQNPKQPAGFTQNVFTEQVALTQEPGVTSPTEGGFFPKSHNLTHRSEFFPESLNVYRSQNNFFNCFAKSSEFSIPTFRDFFYGLRRS